AVAATQHGASAGAYCDFECLVAGAREGVNQVKRGIMACDERSCAALEMPSGGNSQLLIYVVFILFLHFVSSLLELPLQLFLHLLHGFLQFFLLEGKSALHLARSLPLDALNIGAHLLNHASDLLGVHREFDVPLI